MDKAGGTLGPLVGLAVFELVGQRYRPVFVVAFVPCAISVALLWLIRSDVGPLARMSEVAQASARLGSDFWLSVAPLVVVGAARLGEGLVILRLDSMGASTTTILLSFSAMRLANAVVALPAGRLADRVAPQRLVCIGGALIGLVQLGLAVVDLGMALWVLVPVLGLLDPLVRSPTKMSVLRATPGTERGRALGDVQAVIGVASLSVGIAAGLAWAGSGVAPFAVTGVAVLAGSAWAAVRAAQLDPA
jgi:hypothetical protein